MIFSFSVPEDNPRFHALIRWYNSYNEDKARKMERSRDFREMFLQLVGGGDADVRVENETIVEAPVIVEAPPQRRSIVADVSLQPVNLVTTPPEQEIDLDSELDNLTFGGMN